MRRLAALAAAAVTLGACTPALKIRRQELSLSAVPTSCHLVLQWEDSSPTLDPKPPADAAARALRLILDDKARPACGDIRSWQVSKDPSHLAMLSAVWRTELPVLWVSLQHARTGEEKARKIQVRLRARVQKALFDTSEEPMPQTAETWTEAYEGTLKTLFAGLGGLAPQAPALSIHPVEGPGTAEALEASRAGDWKRAAGLWVEASRSQPEGLRVLANAGVAAELAGDLQTALEAEEKLYDAAGGGLSAQLKLVFIGTTRGPERVAQLEGLLALQRSTIATLSPGASLAVLPLDNETPDFDADERVRKGLAAALEAAGYPPLKAAVVDERLKREGVTMAGHLKALKWGRVGKRVQAEFLLAGSIEESRVMPIRQVRARLRLLHAPTAREVFAATLEAGDQRRGGSGQGAAAVVSLVELAAERAAGKTLAAEIKALAESFVGPWPRQR